jgi:hypothetical protein
MAAPADPLDELPPGARRSLEALRAKLPESIRLTNLRRTATGWAVSLYTDTGEYGGEIGIMDEPAEEPNHRPPAQKDRR